MRLHVIFIGIHTGVTDLGMMPQRRLVTIELTPEQVAALEPERIGTASGQAVFETIDLTFLEAK